MEYIDILMIIKGAAIGLLALFILFLSGALISSQIVKADNKAKQKLYNEEKEQDELNWEKYEYKS